MAFIDQYDLANGNPTFQKRVQAAIVKLAKAIQAEDEAGLALPPGFAPAGAADDAAKRQKLHDLRASLANKVLLAPAGYAVLFAQAVAANAAISAGSPDNDIEFESSASWNAFAIT